MKHSLKIWITLAITLNSLYMSSAQNQLVSVYLNSILPVLETCCPDEMMTTSSTLTTKTLSHEIMEECLQELGLQKEQLVDLKNEKADIKGFKLVIEKKEKGHLASAVGNRMEEKYYLKGRSFQKVTRVIRYDDVEIKTAIEMNTTQKLDRDENIKLVPKLHPEIFETQGYVEFFAAVSSPLQIQILKPNGETIRNLQINNMPRPGKNRIQFSLLGLRPGVYYVRFEDEFGITQQRIIKSENSIAAN